MTSLSIDEEYKGINGLTLMMTTRSTASSFTAMRSTKIWPAFTLMKSTSVRVFNDLHIDDEN